MAPPGYNPGAMSAAYGGFNPGYFVPRNGGPPVGAGGAMYFGPPPSHPGAQGGRGGRGGAQGGKLGQGPGKDQLLAAVRQQVEYYFSVENLVKDLFLRGRMDEHGWIPLPVIAGFNRIRMMTPEPGMVLEAIRGSLIVEVEAVDGPDGHRLRKMTDWQSWVMSASERTQTGIPHKAPGFPDGVPPAANVGRPTTILPTIVSMEELNVAGDRASSGVGAGRTTGKPPMAPVTEKDGGAKEGKSIEDEFEMFEMDEDLGDADAGEKKSGEKKHISSRASVASEDEDYGDDIITDEDIARLMIVTQRGGQGQGQGASRNRRGDGQNAQINEGLRFYQRELRSKESGKDRAESSGSWKARSFTGAGSFAGSGSWRGGSGGAHFFPSSFKEGGGAGAQGGGDDIGWLLGSTPTDGGGGAQAWTGAAARGSRRAPTVLGPAGAGSSTARPRGRGAGRLGGGAKASTRVGPPGRTGRRGISPRSSTRATRCSRITGSSSRSTARSTSGAWRSGRGSGRGTRRR